MGREALQAEKTTKAKTQRLKSPANTGNCMVAPCYANMEGKVCVCVCRVGQVGEKGVCMLC